MGEKAAPKAKQSKYTGEEKKRRRKCTQEEAVFFLCVFLSLWLGVCMRSLSSFSSSSSSSSLPASCGDDRRDGGSLSRPPPRPPTHPPTHSLSLSESLLVHKYMGFSPFLSTNEQTMQSPLPPTHPPNQTHFLLISRWKKRDSLLPPTHPPTLFTSSKIWRFPP